MFRFLKSTTTSNKVHRTRLSFPDQPVFENVPSFLLIWAEILPESACLGIHFKPFCRKPMEVPFPSKIIIHQSISLRTPKTKDLLQPTIKLWNSAMDSYIFFLNPDTKVAHAECLKRIVLFMDANSRIGLAGTKVLDSDGSVQESV